MVVAGPFLLIHISIEIIEKAKDNQIELYGLPPHTTHIVQPLDVAIYGPLQGKVKDLGSSIGLFDNSALIGKAKFPALLSTAIDSICSPARIKDAFRKSGLYHVEGDAIDKTQLIPRDFQKKKDTPGEPGTSESYSTESQATVLCDSCGSVINVTINQHNPLVAEGPIPKSLADILVQPVPKPQKPKS